MPKIITKGGKVIERSPKKVIRARKKIRKILRKKKWKQVTPSNDFDVISRSGSTDCGGIAGEEQKFVVREHGVKRDAAWFIKKLDEHAKPKSVKVRIMRRGVKRDSEISWSKGKLVKTKVDGKWRLLLKGGITGKEWLDADWHAGDCFYKLRIHGWIIHQGKLVSGGRKPKHDFMWIPSQDMHKALVKLGWV